MVNKFTVSKSNLSPFFQKRTWLVRPFGFLLLILFPPFFIVTFIFFKAKKEDMLEYLNIALSCLLWDGK